MIESQCCKYISDFKKSGNWNSFVTLHAAANNHLDCMKFAHKNGCKLENFTTKYAVRYGSIECLKYINENECPWDDETTLFAAKYGHLECLKYAYENGCSWHKDTFTFLEKHIDKINLDNIWYRKFFFEQDLFLYPNLQKLVLNKKEQIEKIKSESQVLNKYIPKDINRYIISYYF